MLEARDLSFAYPGKPALYQGFSLAVEPGEHVALRAPSGFGKTTLCSILAGYLQPTAGSVLVDGRPLPARGACPVQMIRQHPEHAVDPRLRLGTTLAEAGMGDGRRVRSLDDPALSERHRALLDDLGIREEWLARYPHELSGGELQRFCVARALAVDARYLVCDEVSTMLDAVTQARLWRVLVHECEERKLGMVLVSHSPALTARVATRVLELG